MNSLQDWDKIVCSVFNSSFSSKHLKVVYINLSSVSIGIKPSYLWDIPAKIDHLQINRMLSLLKEKKLISKNTFTLKLGDDIFCSNVMEIKYLQQNLSELFKKFVNCSSELESPELMTDVVGVHEMLNELLELILKNVSKEMLDIEIKKGWCMPCIYGFLLGYPVIYWTSSCDNNLSHQPLYLFKVNYSNKYFTSKELYSFTVPCVVGLSSYVEDWKKRLVNRMPGVVTMSKEVVVFPSIIL